MARIQTAAHRADALATPAMTVCTSIDTGAPCARRRPTPDWPVRERHTAQTPSCRVGAQRKCATYGAPAVTTGAAKAATSTTVALGRVRRPRCTLGGSPANEQQRGTAGDEPRRTLSRLGAQSARGSVGSAVELAVVHRLAHMNGPDGILTVEVRDGPGDP